MFCYTFETYECVRWCLSIESQTSLAQLGIQCYSYYHCMLNMKPLREVKATLILNNMVIVVDEL